jgi:putative SOS response-associated peptidase YedK
MPLKYILASDLITIEKRFNALPHPDLLEIQKSYSVSSGDYSYVITVNNIIQVFHFGMTPQFAMEQLNILTAIAEGKKNNNDDPNYNGSKAIFLQPEFKKPIFSQRCIVIADAFYERSDTNKPYVVYLQNKIRQLDLLESMIFGRILKPKR